MKLAGVERKEAEGVARCRMERDVVERNAYEMARAGGRHAGLLRTYQGKSTEEIERALRSYERQVDLHRQKLRNSEQFVTDWATKSARMQEGLLRHWRQDLVRNQELAEVMRGILRDRGIQP
jgi:hypothetical protein